ncbi:type IV pili methyl-accepting chemotaxis transducer N-terminal domain-containing protein [Zoogloea sp.]|uniref:type IV pili methyl-accepting chemotaxis transducer N-terminal domain-containing protein n=1 Tax=Zoogloea sp. TaxID=49181 RepID=UPI0035B1BCED
MQRRRFLALAGACGCVAMTGALSAPVSPDAAGGSALAAVINKAGRQRMLSQRTAKAWLMRVLGVQPDRAGILLSRSVQLFDLQMTELKAIQPSDEVRGAVQQLEQEWARYRPLLNDLRSDPKAVWNGSEAVLAAAHKLTLAYEKSVGSPAGQLVNLAGRQRMLSQRMAKAYFFRQLGVNTGPAGEMLDAAVKEFTKAHETLKASPQNTPQLKTELALVEQQWFFFRNALGLNDAADQKKAAEAVGTTSERILEQMDLVVGLYEKLARDA